MAPSNFQRMRFFLVFPLPSFTAVIHCQSQTWISVRNMAVPLCSTSQPREHTNYNLMLLLQAVWTSKTTIFGHQQLYAGLEEQKEKAVSYKVCYELTVMLLNRLLTLDHVPAVENHDDDFQISSSTSKRKPRKLQRNNVTGILYRLIIPWNGDSKVLLIR